jgi:hypothetical protein
MSVAFSTTAVDLSELLSIVGVGLSALNPIMGNNSIYFVIDGHFEGAIAPSLLREPVRSALLASDCNRFVEGERSGLILVRGDGERYLSLAELRALAA